jgi:hypothetical protein
MANFPPVRWGQIGRARYYHVHPANSRGEERTDEQWGDTMSARDTAA